MKEGVIFVIVMIIFIYAAWVATGGPSNAMSHAGPWITPVTRSGEQQQGYHVTPPANPLDPSAYPKQVKTTPQTVISAPDNYTRTTTGPGTYPPPQH